VIHIQLNDRLKKIIEIVKEHEPITGEEIAKLLNVTRATLRPDLAVLTMVSTLGARPKVGYYYMGKKDQALTLSELKERKVKDLMSLPIVLPEETTVYNAIVTLFLEDIGSIFVTNHGYLSGVISRKDLLKTAIGGSDINQIPIAMVMTRMPNLVISYENESIVMAATKIMDHEIDSLPVVEIDEAKGKEHYKVIGRITKTNITKLFVEVTGE
jgi:DeoR family transcriptional regulator, catabolite repression regulator